MENYTDAFRRIKSLECPTGDIEERIQEILAIYDVAEDTSITRDQSHDREGLAAYRIDFTNEEGPAKIILAKSGAEDYVVRVIDILDE